MMVVLVCGGPTGAVVRLGATVGDEEHATKTAEKSRQTMNNCFASPHKSRSVLIMQSPVLEDTQMLTHLCDRFVLDRLRSTLCIFSSASRNQETLAP